MAANGSGYVFIGVEVDENGRRENVNFTLLDKKGTISTSQSIFYNDTIQIKNAGEVIRLSDGTFVFSAVLAKDSLNKVISRIDNFGNIFWTVTTGVETDFRTLAEAPSPILEVPTEKIFHAHIISSSANNNDIQLTGINFDGTVDFVQRIALQQKDNTDLDERIIKMKLSADSTIMILGTTDSPETPVFLSKMDTFGTILWTRSYNGDFGRSLDTEGYDLVQLVDNTWVVLGSVESSPTARHGGFLMQVDNNGELLRTETFSPTSVRYQLYPNGIIGTLDTSVVVGLKRLDMIGDTVQPMIFKYDLDSIIDYQTLLDTVVSADLSSGSLVTSDSLSAAYMATTIKDNFRIPYLAKVDEDGNTECHEQILSIEIDTANFIRDTLLFTVTDMEAVDSIVADGNSFGRYNPPILNVNDTTYCPQDPINYFVDASVRGAVQYLWDDGNTDSTRVFKEEGMFMVTVTVREDICFTLCDTLTITQLEFPQVTIQKNFGNYCSTGVGILSAAIMGASIQEYAWSTGATTSTIIVDGTPMEYSVTVTDGCGNNADASTNVSDSDTDIANPLGLVVSDENLCSDGTLTITAAEQTDPSLLTWSTGATNTLSISVDGPGTYTADVGGFCPDTESISISEADFIPPIDAEILFECANPAILRVVGTGFTAQTWSTGDTESTIGISEPGSYEVILEDECGNQDSSLDPFIVTAEDIDACTSCEIPCLVWPNAFQPMDNQEENTTFGPKLRSDCTTGLVSYELRVFNRWGKEIFVSNSFDVRWNGEINGNPQPGGVYFYWTRYNDGFTTCERKGDVTLLR